MASIKQVAERKYKITISNGYRTDGKSAKRKRFRYRIAYRSVALSSTSTTKLSVWSAYSSRAIARTLK